MGNLRSNPLRLAEMIISERRRQVVMRNASDTPAQKVTSCASSAQSRGESLRRRSSLVILQSTASKIPAHDDAGRWEGPGNRGQASALPCRCPVAELRTQATPVLMARYGARMSPASDNPAFGSLRRALLSKIEALLNATELRQVK
jgi:hypothetical protein